jgi:hypothetical protein
VRSASIICAVLGATASLAASGWLLLGFDPTSEKYSRVEGGGYSQSVPTGLQRLLKDQAKAAGMAVLGGALQLASVILGLLAS